MKKQKTNPCIVQGGEISETSPSKVIGYLPDDRPPMGAMLNLGFQQFLTLFPATVLVAILTKFDIGITLLVSGLGTIIALLVSLRSCLLQSQEF